MVQRWVCDCLDCAVGGYYSVYEYTLFSLYTGTPSVVRSHDSPCCTTYTAVSQLDSRMIFDFLAHTPYFSRKISHGSVIYVLYFVQVKHEVFYFAAPGMIHVWFDYRSTRTLYCCTAVLLYFCTERRTSGDLVPVQHLCTSASRYMQQCTRCHTIRSRTASISRQQYSAIIAVAVERNY